MPYGRCVLQTIGDRQTLNGSTTEAFDHLRESRPVYAFRQVTGERKSREGIGATRRHGTTCQAPMRPSTLAVECRVRPGLRGWMATLR